jgi:hypothetical protein
MDKVGIVKAVLALSDEALESLLDEIRMEQRLRFATRLRNGDVKVSPEMREMMKTSSAPQAVITYRNEIKCPLSVAMMVVEHIRKEEGIQ